MLGREGSNSLYVQRDLIVHPSYLVLPGAGYGSCRRTALLFEPATPSKVPTYHDMITGCSLELEEGGAAITRRREVACRTG